MKLHAPSAGRSHTKQKGNHNADYHEGEVQGIATGQGLCQESTPLSNSIGFRPRYSINAAKTLSTAVMLFPSINYKTFDVGSHMQSTKTTEYAYSYH